MVWHHAALSRLAPGDDEIHDAWRITQTSYTSFIFNFKTGWNESKGIIHTICKIKND
jgi:hypothetical protein